VVVQRLAESEIFVACLTPQYIADPVCRKEIAMAVHLGKTIVPLLFGPMPGMYDSPGSSAGLCVCVCWYACVFVCECVCVCVCVRHV